MTTHHGSPARLLLVTLALASVFEACTPGREATDVVAYVGERPVAFSDFEIFVRANAGAEWTRLEEDVLALLFERFLDELLLARLAEDLGLVEANSDRATALRALRRAAAAQTVGEAEVRQYLEAHPAVRLRPERLTLGQLLIEDREVAERAQEELRRGRSFEAVAEELAELPGVVYGGYTRNVTRSDLPLAFRDLLFSLSAGEVTGILAAEYGYHIFHVPERRPDETLSSSEAADAALDELVRLQTDERLAELLEEARDSHPVEVLSWNLPFHRDVEGEPDHVSP